MRADEHGGQSGQHRDRRGFASMDQEKQRQIASKGGHVAHERGTAHEFTSNEAREAGRKGGEAVSQNREHMAEIGRKGGEAVSQNREHMAEIGRKGGESRGSRQGNGGNGQAVSHADAHQPESHQGGAHQGGHQGGTTHHERGHSASDH